MATFLFSNFKANLRNRNSNENRTRLNIPISTFEKYHIDLNAGNPLQLTGTFHSFIRSGTDILRCLIDPVVAECEILPPDFHPELRQTLDHLKPLAGKNNPNLVSRKEKNGVEIFGHKDGKLEDGLPVARLGTAVFNVPVEDVAACWWHFNARKDWDSVNTTESQAVRDEGPDKRLVYLKAKAKPMISPRDFAFTSCRVPASSVGAMPGSKVFVQVNNPDAVPTVKGAVRADVNSILILEPVGLMQTKATYIVEMDAKGWIPHYAVNAAADDLPLTLGVMREYLEDKLAVLNSGTDEEAARAIVRERQSEEERHRDGAATLVSSVAASREDLLETKKMLQKKLHNLKKDEKELGIKLDDLRKKIESDLKKVNQRL